MSKWPWVTFEGLVGLAIGAFLGWLAGGACLMVSAALGASPPGELRLVILLSTTAAAGVGLAVFYGKRAADAYEGRGKPGRSVITGAGGKPELTIRSVIVFSVLALAWAFWVLLIQSWGHH